MTGDIWICNRRQAKVGNGGDQGTLDLPFDLSDDANIVR